MLASLTALLHRGCSVDKTAQTSLTLELNLILSHIEQESYGIAEQWQQCSAHSGRYWTPQPPINILNYLTTSLSTVYCRE